MTGRPLSFIIAPMATTKRTPILAAAAGAIAAAGLTFGLMSLSVPNTEQLGLLQQSPLVPGVVIADGDSMTAGLGLTADEAWPGQAAVQYPEWDVHNVAVSGNSCETDISEYEARVLPLRDPGQINVVFLMCGADDLIAGTTPQETFDIIKAYADTARADGLRPVVSTIANCADTSCLILGAGAFDALRLELNDILRARWREFAYGLIDVERDQRIGGASNDPVFYQNDFRNWTAAGAAVYDSLAAPVIRRALNRSSAFPTVTGTPPTATSTPSLTPTPTASLTPTPGSSPTPTATPDSINVVTDGDSITFGAGLDPGERWPDVMATAHPDWTVTDVAISGKACNGLAYVDPPSHVDNYFDPDATNVAFLFCGINDIVSGGADVHPEAIFLAIWAWADARTAAGFRPVVTTIAGWGTGSEQNELDRLALNQMIRDHWQDFAWGFVDLEADPRLGPLTTGGDPYFLDTVHFSAAGAAVYESLAAPEIATVAVASGPFAPTAAPTRTLTPTGAAPTATPTTTPTATVVSAGWWNNGGAIAGARAAYAPIQATTIAQSFVNKAVPGTYNAYRPALPNTPSLVAGAGWRFDRTAATYGQFLKTTMPVVSDQTWSCLVRFDMAAPNGGSLFGRDSATGYFALYPKYLGDHNYAYNGGTDGDVFPGFLSGVLGLVGPKVYHNGTDQGITISTGASSNTAGIYIGATNNGTVQPSSRVTADIAALACYDVVLSPSDEATISSAMQGLP